MEVMKYLSSSPIIDWEDPAIEEKASALSHGLADDVEIARRCFHFVRDEIPHSADYKMDPVTLRASDVLKRKTGFCYAKSHLLTALLRANGIPAGLCYQRLASDTIEGKFNLHGLNAIYLKDFGWYRVDARGNSDRVHAEFTPPKESLAFIPKKKGEVDLPEVWVEPLPCVVIILSNHTHYDEVLSNLPDVEIINGYPSKSMNP